MSNAIVAEAPVVEAPAVHEAGQQAAEQAQRLRDERGRFASSEVRAVEDDLQAEAAPVEQQPEAPAAEAEAQAEPQAEAQPEEELEVIEFDGKQYQVPKPLRGAFLMEADYRRKTMEVAEQRRAVEAQAKQLAERSRLDDEALARQVEMASLDHNIRQYAALNWDQLTADNPAEATRLWMQYQSLKDKRTDLTTKHSEWQTKRQAEAEHEVRQRLVATQEYAQKNVPGWSPDMDLRIIEFAKSKGASEQDIAQAMNPTVYEILRLAEIGEQTLKRTTASAKPAPAVAPKPTSTVGGRANPSAGKSLYDPNLSMEEYVALRNKQSAA